VRHRRGLVDEYHSFLRLTLSLPPTFLLSDKLPFFSNQCHHSLSRYYNPWALHPYPFQLDLLIISGLSVASTYARGSLVQFLYHAHPACPGRLGHRRALHFSFVRPLSCSQQNLLFHLSFAPSDAKPTGAVMRLQRLRQPSPFPESLYLTRAS
jgi:hypothetical protein